MLCTSIVTECELRTRILEHMLDDARVVEHRAQITQHATVVVELDLNRVRIEGEEEAWDTLIAISVGQDFEG